MSTIRLPGGVKVQVELPYKEAIILACLATDKLNCEPVVREAPVLVREMEGDRGNQLEAGRLRSGAGATPQEKAVWVH